jgi:hypothetical protein
LVRQQTQGSRAARLAAISGVVAFAVFAVTPSGAQQLPGMIDMMPNMNATSNAAIGTLRTKILARERAGRRRIKAGKATTTFTPSPAGTKLALARMNFNDPEDPKTPEAQMAYFRGQVREFNRRMSGYGLRPNDLADGYTMAHALSYEAYHGKRLPDAQRKANRADIRQLVLTGEGFQGMTDAEREELYGMYAAASVYAIECRERAEKTSDPKEKAALIARAQRNAKSLGLMKFK